MTHTFKVGDKGKTREGSAYEVTAIGQDYLLAVIEDGNEYVFYKNGTREGEYSQTTSDLDLIPTKPRIQGWLNIYNCGPNRISGPYKSEQDAEAYSGSEYPERFRVACKYIDIEEGDGLEEI